MRKRDIERELKILATEFPAVSIYGPRQSGKTTLAKMAFPKKPWITFESPDNLHKAQTDPRGLLDSYPDGAIFDEIQRVPDLLSYLQEYIDRDRRPGRYVLTGSHQAQLKHGVAQSLAGRTAILTLLPYSLHEIAREDLADADAFALIQRGFYPQLHETDVRTASFFPAYLATFLERDLPSLLEIRNRAAFEDFLFLLASRVGQLVNMAQLANDVGVSKPTIAAWISALEESGIVFVLRSWTRNARRRVVKAPKIYFTDTGLAAWLARAFTRDAVAGGIMRGGLYENFVIIEAYKRILNAAAPDQLSFFRDTNGNEVDLVIERGGRLIPVEIKSASTFSGEFGKGILTFRRLYPKESEPGVIAYNGPTTIPLYKQIHIMNPLRTWAF